MSEQFQIYNRRYLGSKYKLVDFIHDVIDKHCKNINSVLDIFAGTGIVGYSFNKDHAVIVNDTLVSNETVYNTFFGNGKVDHKKLETIIDNYNRAIPKADNYYSKNFADTYLSKKNMRKVGYIRDNIDKLYKQKEINDREKDILICSLLYAIDHIANTVGHYDAYRKGGELDRRLVLRMPDLSHDKDNKNNQYFCEDANELAKHIKADLVYIDPPYNSRQYCDAYHFLENVAQNKKPEVYGVARKMDRSNEKSLYCTNKAPDAFADLIDTLDAKYILVSYSDTGKKGNDRSNAKISDNQIMEILRRKGKVQVFEQDFNIFTTGKTGFRDHKERLFLCTVGTEETEHPEASPQGLIKSPLNYTGGKYKILDQLMAKFPNDINAFYDIFCGGVNVGVNVAADKTICIDNNERLIHLLKYLQATDYYDLMEQLEALIKKYKLSNTYQNGYEHYDCDSGNGVGRYNKEPYAKMKTDYNDSKDKPDDLFLLLIVYGFNNQIRFNRNGEFNLPVGKRDFNASLRKKLEQFMSALKTKDITFKCMDFKAIKVNDLPKDAFLYLDPPYSLGDATYNENGEWTDKDDYALMKFLDKCNENEIRFALSNVIEHKSIINEKLLQWTLRNSYNVNYITRNYHNASYHVKDKTAKTKEVLITNY